MSLISSLRTYIGQYSSMPSGAPIWVDYLGTDVEQYSIIPIPGNPVLEDFIDGSSLRVFPFAFQSVESIADNASRMQIHEFYEAFAEWLDSQTEAGTFPTLDSGQTAEAIEAVSWAMMMQPGNSSSGIYQIQCRMLYTQEAS